jgi:sulfofructosephosphate aldolase
MTSELASVSIDAFRGKSGKFAMLAIDQRESLRQMLARASAIPSVPDEALESFKIQASSALTPFASGVLLDRSYGLEAARASHAPVILAADLLYQDVPGGPVTRAELDEGVDSAVITLFNASALKMLVPWLPDQRDLAIDLSARFMDLCRRLGTLGIVEGVVRPADFESWPMEAKNDALVTAARDLAGTRPDLYKAEVPQFGLGEREGIVSTARRITESLECPWVVLSSGVPADIYPSAVAASIQGGASGFLAGRAIWADAITAPDTSEFLKNESARRLQELTKI